MYDEPFSLPTDLFPAALQEVTRHSPNGGGQWRVTLQAESITSLLVAAGAKVTRQGLSHVAYFAADSLDCALPGRATERYSISHFGQVT
jgi:hypothetical protein